MFRRIKAQSLRARSAFLALVVIVLGATITATTLASCEGESETPITEEIYNQIGGGGGGRDFVLYLDRLIDQLPEEPMSVSDADIVMWELEVLPFFGYEGLVNFPTVPSAVTLRPYLDPMQHNHILGRAYCNSLADTSPVSMNIEINARTANPVSAWYQNASRFLPTLIHEMTHIQGVCGSAAESETATQVVTLEILAALVNGGNTLAMRPLLIELRDIALAAMELEAIESADEGRMNEFVEFYSAVKGSAFEDARFEKSRRFWSQSVGHRNQLEYILRAYNAEVFERIVFAFGNDGLTEEMYLPEYAEVDDRITIVYDGTRPFEVDDLVYFVNNAEELVEEYVGTESGLRG